MGGFMQYSQRLGEAGRNDRRSMRGAFRPGLLPTLVVLGLLPVLLWLGDGRAVVAELTGFHVSSLAGGKENVVILRSALVWIKPIITVLPFVFSK